MMASIGHSSIVWIQKSTAAAGTVFSITLAFPPFAVPKTSGHIPAHKPHPMHLLLSIATFMIEPPSLETALGAVLAPSPFHSTNESNFHTSLTMASDISKL
jgi:hypothetical protein